MYALVDKGVVIQIERDSTPVHASLQWVAIPPAMRDYVEPYWRFDGVNFQPPAELDLKQKWDHMRMERNHMLADCDWTQLSDSPLKDMIKHAWSLYRQKLRDLPQSKEDPDSIQWPKAPKSGSSGS